MDSNQIVVLVDENDCEIGIEDKNKAHQNGGKLHRSVSVYVFSENGELMMQRRSSEKYHSPSLWSNTCCGHPLPDETSVHAAHRRLQYEMGFDCELKEIFHTIFKGDVGKNMIEWEYGHVFFGTYNARPKINLDEVGSWKWTKIESLLEDVNTNSHNYSPWVEFVLQKVLKYNDRVEESDIVNLSH